MTDPIIHQLYCTHCTYGTSALHRHTGNIKDQPFEYSTRAGSVEKAASHETFQRFEKMYFRGLPLPSDTPADARQRLTADSSTWRRLIAAKTAGANLVAHVAYRTSDTSTPPRTGSYFAHLLLHDATEPTQPSWSLSEALQMWGADFWVVEDRGDIPHDLDSVSQLTRLPGFGSVINDAKLLSFLTTPARGDFGDGRPGSRDEPSPKCAIPQRWREAPVEERLALFTALFHSVATLNLDRRERLLVAVEPSLAALLFYGIIRLLPRQGLVDQLSVSTFEPHADPFSTVLTATDFYDPSRAEQYLAGLRGGVTIFNTYNPTPRQDPRESPESRYVGTMLAKFIGPNGPAVVDGKRGELAAAGKSGLSNIRDCEQYFGASELAERLLRTGAPPVSERDISALSLDVARQKFRMTLLTRLRSLSNDEQTWTGLAQSPSRVTLMAHVLSEEPALPNSAGTLEQLCDCLPANELPRFFEDRLISGDLRLARLQRAVIEAGQLPAGCESLWTPANHGAGVDRPLLEKLFAALDPGKLRSLCQTVFESAAIKREMAGPQTLIMLTYLARAAKDNSRKRSDLTSLLEDDRLEEDHWDVLLRDPALRSILFEVYPNDDPILHVKLTDLLDRLSDSGRKFPLRLDILKAAESRLPDDRRQELSRWLRVRASLEELKRLQSEPAGLIDRFVTGACKNRMRELGASVANECQKILEANYGPQNADKQFQDLKPLLCANCVSGEIPAAFRAGMMQTLRGPDAPRVARKSQKQESPTLVATAIAWLPVACATLLVAVIVTGVYWNQDAIKQLLVDSPRKSKPKPPESPPTEGAEGTTHNSSTPNPHADGATASAAQIEAQKREAKRQELARLETKVKEHDQHKKNDAGNSTTIATDVPKVPVAGSTESSPMPPVVPWKLDDVYIAESRDLPLSKLLAEKQTFLIKQEATVLTFHTLHSAYPRLFSSGDNTSTLSINVQLSEAATRMDLCTLTATASGVEITKNNFDDLLKKHNLDAPNVEKAWGMSVLGLRNTNPNWSFYSFREPKRVTNGWLSEIRDDRIIFPFDKILPDWVSREPEVLNALAIGPGQLQLQRPKDPPAEWPADNRLQYSSSPFKIAHRMPLDPVSVNKYMLIRACDLDRDAVGVQMSFHLYNQQQKSLDRNSKRTPVASPLHKPTDVSKALLAYSGDLGKLKQRFDKNEKISLSEYDHICALFGIDVTRDSIPDKKDEKPADKSKRQEEADDAHKARYKDELKKVIGKLSFMGPSQSVFNSGFNETILHGSVYLVVEGENGKDGNLKAAFAVRVADCGDYGRREK